MSGLRSGTGKWPNGRAWSARHALPADRYHASCFAVLLPPSVPAAQDDPRLDRLFAELRELDKRRDARARELQAHIWHIWYEHEDAAVNARMQSGLAALSQGRYADAVEAFTQAIERDPEFAEAWNRRATTYYLMERYEDSLADIERVLAREPRHFAALAGRGLLPARTGRPRAALEAFERALEINPHLDGVYVETIRLRARLDSES
ncbi:MAG: tetratricopeptide repeat protein [Trueperaceae bacterium]|nr:tetratricopeptide repeat protein [Trueperaceae bacterium]